MQKINHNNILKKPPPAGPPEALRRSKIRKGREILRKKELHQKFENDLQADQRLKQGLLF